ncbi:DinB family protein [Pseudooceanicola nanhaiensis]|uniref:DinB family protein n=1 Tax=Pseudooceanicola nanhaiensis TaxID=375761 RepID=UPI001CD5B389|nr:DinB family protein [Pseudooceanicola nanhaiensis]MCA0921517.1 DinB family protein [Pseudooceanicola nanhaiensis]
MITPAYCLMMARYNAWQNWQIAEVFDTLDSAALHEDRGAFFGSLLSTANHILWADQMWMSRFAGLPKPDLIQKESGSLTASAQDWRAERAKMDAALLGWAAGLEASDVTGELTWYSGSIKADVRANRAQLITHMFNHQTHHRGQIHGLLTAIGKDPGVTDLAFLPETGPWA